MNWKFTFTTFLFLLGSLYLSAQDCTDTGGGCPGGGVDTEQEITDCIAANGPVNIKNNENLSVSCDYDLSGISISIGNSTTFRFTGNITVSSGTSFSGDNASSSLNVGSITITNSSSPSFTDLNNALADLGSSTPSLASVIAMLPVEFITFTGKAEQGKVVLQWATATESNNKHFEVEHSLDGKQFKVIDVIPGSGTSFERKDYTFEHKQAISGLNYYRLRQVDFDGTFDYSDLISVQLFGKKSGYRVFPNPAKERFTIFAKSGETPTQITLYNTLGQEVSLTPNESGSYLLPKLLQAGTYILKIEGNGGSHFERLLIQ